ncbi:MAG: DUF5606 domain-containing protein [Bacteroidales bacterium]
MALKDYMSISGLPGLYKFVSQGRNGIIVESLTDGRRSHVSASAKVSALSDIAIFTNDGEKPLGEVLEKIKERENGEPTISHKSSNDELKKFFLEVLPDYDVDRVYVSDIKKVVAWYNQLQSLGIVDFKDDEDKQPADEKDKDADAKGDAPKEEAKEKPAEKKKPQPKKPKQGETVKKPAAKKATTKKAGGSGSSSKKS